MLTAAQKEQWLKDLRSGEFKQGTSRLCTVYHDGTEYYCCLGVLAHRYADKYVLDDVDGFKRKMYYFGDDPNYYSGVTPDSLYFSTYVVAMNDQGIPFSEIADWIEANVRTEG